MDLSFFFERILSCTVTQAIPTSRDRKALASIVIETKHLARHPSWQAQAYNTRPPTPLFHLTCMFSRARRIDPTCCIWERLDSEIHVFRTFLEGTFCLKHCRAADSNPRHHISVTWHGSPRDSTCSFLSNSLKEARAAGSRREMGSIRRRDTGENTEFTPESPEDGFPLNLWPLSSPNAPLAPSDRLCHLGQCQWTCPPSIL